MRPTVLYILCVVSLTVSASGLDMGGWRNAVVSYIPQVAVPADADVLNMDDDSVRVSISYFDGLATYNNLARAHFPLTGTFSHADSHGSDTPWLSNYIHCAANPVNIIDPDGRKLRVLDEDQRAYTLDFNSSGNIIAKNYEGGSHNVEVLLNTINEISSGLVGRSLIYSLIDNIRTISIVASDMNCYCDYTVSVNIETPAHAVVFKNGIQKRDVIPLYAALAHELFHAEDFATCNMDESAWFILGSTTNSKKNVIKNAEKYAIIGENMIRAEHQDPIRLGYVTFEDGNDRQLKEGLLFGNQNMNSVLFSKTNRISFAARLIYRSVENHILDEE